MGGVGSGRPVDLARRRQAAELRRQGHTLAEIALALGVSRQAAAGLLRRSTAASPPGVNHLAIKCCRCGAVLCVGDFHGNTSRTALCLPCLEALPCPTFGQRVRAYRLARGWPMKRLARELGLSVETISAWERSKNVPRWRTVERLFRVLGVELTLKARQGEAGYAKRTRRMREAMASTSPAIS